MSNFLANLMKKKKKTFSLHSGTNTNTNTIILLKYYYQYFLCVREKKKKNEHECICTGSCSAVGISATKLFEALCMLECFYGLLDMSHCGAFTLKCN